MKEPSPTASNGRRSNGQFLPGNRLAKGNPAAKKAQALRFALMKAVKPTDLRRIVAKLIDLAASGDVQAAKLILDRTLGPATAVDVEQRLTELEAKFGG
jgi:hypothetical protein